MGCAPDSLRPRAAPFARREPLPADAGPEPEPAPASETGPEVEDMATGGTGLRRRIPPQTSHPQPPPPSQTHAIHKNNDIFTCEFSINEASYNARTILTKGFIQDEISQCSGAAISTRGRFIPKTDKPDSLLIRPLYLFIQASSKQSIETAIQKIEEMIRKNSGGNNPFVRMNNDSIKQVEKIFIGLDHLPASFDLRGKIIGRGGSNLDYIINETGATVSLRGCGSLFIDPQLGHESREPLHLFIEHRTQDGLVAARQLAVNLIETLASEIQQVMPDSQHQQQQPNLSTGQQMVNLPPQIVGMPPLTVPPPQQQFTSVPTVQQPQNIDQPLMMNNNPADAVQGQLQHLRNQQIQHVQQVAQPQQQMILQPPPPLARAPIVSIPPPGIHIPQHAGPMVPPPQLVQLSAPPPTAASSGNVLVVAPPPTQSIYLPPDMTASSSVGTFSFLQGGVLYHQAPPIQTQAQISDGPHIISAPPQATVENVNMSMNSHTQPPPHMIFTQVQVEPNNQIASQAGDQLTHTYQQPIVSQQQQKTQYHLIGHMQGPVNHDQSNIQQSQTIIQQQPREMQNMDGFSHFSINNQTSTPTSIVFTLPYHMTVTSNTSSTTTIPITHTQIQQMTGAPNQNIQLQQSEQENILKQLPRQIMHTGFLSTQHRQPRNDRNAISVQLAGNQLQTSQPPNIQPSLEHIIFTQPPNSQALINQVSHIPANQIITSQMPPGSIATNAFLSSQQANQHIQNQLMSNQQGNPVMVPQQDLAQLTNNQMNQLPPIPTNQMPPNQIQQNQLSINAMTTNQITTSQIPPNHIPPGQMLNQEQLNQQINLQQSLQSQQIQRQQQQFNQMSFDHSSNRQEPRMQENQGRNRMNQGRNRKQSRNNRQNSYPWNKNDQDKSNSNWGKRDNDRNFDYDRKNDEYCNDNRVRYQQSNSENSQNDERKSQYRNNLDKDRGQYDEKSSNSSQSGSRYQYEKNEKSHDSQNTWNRDKCDNQHDDSSDNCRKRKYDQEGSKWSRSDDSDNAKGDNDSENSGLKRRFDKDGNWSRSDNTQISGSSDSSSIHKSRFEPEEPNKIDAGSQPKQNTGRTSSAKTFGTNDPTKPDKETASKWSDQSGETRSRDVNEKHMFEDDDSPKESSNKMELNSLQNINEIDKLDQSLGSMSDRVRNQINQLNQKQATSWCEQRQDFKGNPQYAIAGQFHSTITEADKQYNPNIQQGFMNNVQIFQNTVPFLFPPPPPPPPHTQPQNNMQQQQQQHNIQFNLNQDNNSNHMTNAPPNMAIVNANIPQSLSQNMSLNQNVIQTVNQSMPPNIVSSMSSHLVPNVPPSMGPNMPNNMNQNVPFDMGQNIISSMSQSLPPNTNQNMTTNISQTIPPGMTQNVQTVTQTLPPNNIQVNLQNPSSIGQILPSSMPHNVVTNIPPNMGQNIIQNMPPYMPQSMASNMPQTVTHHMGQNISIMGQSITSSASQNLPPMMNQNLPPNMSSMIGTNTTNVTHTIPMSISNNLGQNVSMMQSVVGQVPMNVGPTMVPPPPNMLHGTVPQTVPNMVPPPVMPPNITNNRPQMSTQQSMSAVPPPPPPPSIHTMTSQPPYSYWMGS